MCGGRPRTAALLKLAGGPVLGDRIGAAVNHLNMADWLAALSRSTSAVVDRGRNRVFVYDLDVIAELVRAPQILSPWREDGTGPGSPTGAVAGCRPGRLLATCCYTAVPMGRRDGHWPAGPPHRGGGEAAGGDARRVATDRLRCPDLRMKRPRWM